MKVVKDKLEKLQKNKSNQLEYRKSQGLKTVSIVGYTNAGKSTLFNVLTKKDKKAEDVLFATLDSAVGKLYLPDKQRYADYLISDTIGFIQKLPPELIDAFKSTLMESTVADLILHIIDIADPKMHEKVAIVENILTQLGLHDKPQMYVFNKIDETATINRDELIDRYNEYNPQFISAKNNEGIKDLIKVVEERMIDNKSSL